MSDLVTRIESWRQNDNQGYDTAIALLCEAEAELVSLRAARDTAEQRVKELEASEDAFMEGQEASLRSEPRSINPYPPGDSHGIGELWSQWDDGYDCNINRALKAQLASATAQREALNHPAKLLALSLTDGMLESVQREWGPMDTAVLRHWRGLVLAALADPKEMP